MFEILVPVHALLRPKIIFRGASESQGESYAKCVY